jgi:hypothetical protein
VGARRRSNRFGSRLPGLGPRSPARSPTSRSPLAARVDRDGVPTPRRRRAARRPPMRRRRPPIMGVPRSLHRVDRVGDPHHRQRDPELQPHPTRAPAHQHEHAEDRPAEDRVAERVREVEHNGQTPTRSSAPRPAPGTGPPQGPQRAASPRRRRPAMTLEAGDPLADQEDKRRDDQRVPGEPKHVGDARRRACRRDPDANAPDRDTGSQLASAAAASSQAARLPLARKFERCRGRRGRPPEAQIRPSVA